MRRPNATPLRRVLPLLLGLLPVPAFGQTWLYDSAHTLPSTDTGWDAMAFDAASKTLFVARRSDGLLAWNPATGKGDTVANSKGAMGVVLAPEFHRGYAPMADGTVLIFDTQTLAVLDRPDLGAGELAQGFYEPSQQRVHLITAPRTDKAATDKTLWITLDASNGAVLNRTEFNNRRMDPPATDGKGAVFAPIRERGLLQQLDAKDLSLQKTWKLGDCTQPVAAAWNAASQRVLVACRGDKPVFVALNPASGVVATVPIGRGVDGLVMDPARKLVVTANGGDGTISVIRETGPDAYALEETIASRPMARTLQLDEQTGRLFTVTATFTQPAPGPDGKAAPYFYHPDSFTILSYRRP